MINNIQRPKNFTLKLDKLGLDTCRSSYSEMKCESALVLSFSAVEKITDAFVGKEHSPALRYDLAVQILKGIKGFEFEELKKEIEAEQPYTENRIKNWSLKTEQVKK